MLVFEVCFRVLHDEDQVVFFDCHEVFTILYSRKHESTMRYEVLLFCSTLL